MPDFDVELTGGADWPWVDTPSTNPIAPTRLNPDPAHLPTFYKLTAPATVTIQAKVGGVLAPMDSNPVMAGRLFSVTMSEWSGDSEPPVTLAAGQSSLITIAIAVQHEGHHVCLVSLSDGMTSSGAIGCPFDVEVV